MSTRAVYTFIDNYHTHHVYKHCDNYPGGAAQFINDAIEFAWDMPRFEADDFAAAFVAVNRGKRGGEVRLTHHYDRHGDLAYRYEISCRNDEIHVHAFERLWNLQDMDEIEYESIFEGTIKEFVKLSQE